MSEQTASASGRGQRGADFGNLEPNGPDQDESGANTDEGTDAVPASADIEATEDPSKD